jgi:hypothetical protein
VRQLLTLSLGLLACSAASCSGRTVEDPPPPPNNTSGNATLSTGGGAGSGALVPGQSGGSAASSTGGEGADPSVPTVPLQGPAFFDFDCSPNRQLPEGDACAQCQVTSCGEELSNALGNDWILGRALGPCREWFECIQACPCNDQACYRSCVGALGEAPCEASFIALDACVTEECQSRCSSPP